MSQNETIKTPQDYVNYTFNINARGVAEVSGELMGLSNTVTNILGQIAFKTSEFLAHTEMLAIGAGAAVSATFVKATQDAIRFEQQVANVKAIGGEAVDANLIGAKAMDYSNKFGMAVSQMTEGLEALARAGITATGVMSQVLEEGVKLSKLEGMDLEESINDLISTTNLLAQNNVDMNAPEYAEMLKAMNQHIVSTSESAPINAQNIIQTLQHVGGYASASGMDQDDLFAVIAQLGARGTKGEMAGTALRAFIAAGQKDTAQRALARIGLTVEDLWDENGETMLPISEMKNVLDEALEARGFSKQEKLEFYSDFAGYKQANQIMKINTSEVKEYKEQIANAWDLGKKLDTILGTVRGNLDRIWQISQNFMTKVGGKMLTMANVMLTPIRKILEIFTKIPFADTGTALVMMFVGFRTILGIFTKIVPALGAFISHSRDGKEYAKGIRGEWEKTVDSLKLSKEILNNITDSREMTKIYYRERGLSAQDKAIIEDEVAGQMYMDKEMYREYGLAWSDLNKPVKNMIIAEFKQTDEFDENYKEYVRRTKAEVKDVVHDPIIIADFSGTDELEAINTYVQYIFDLLSGRRTSGADNRTPEQNNDSSSGNRDRNRRINNFREIGNSILNGRRKYGDYNWKSSVEGLWDPVESTNLDELYRLQEKINNQIDKKINDYIEFNSRNLNETGKARVQKSLTRNAMSNFGIAFSTYANTSDIRHYLETGERRSSGQLFTEEQLIEALRVMNVNIGSNDVPTAELIRDIYQQKRDEDADLLDKISNATQKIWHQKQSTRTDVSYFPTRALVNHRDVADKLMDLVGVNSISEVQNYFSSSNVDNNILEEATKIMASNHDFMDEIVEAEITYMYENLARVQNTILKIEQNSGPRGHASTGRITDAQIRYEYQRLQKSDYYLAEAGQLNMIGKPGQSNDRLAMFQQYGNLAVGGQGYNRRDTLGREDGYGHITISPGTIKFYADNEKFDYDNGYGNLLLETIVHEMGHVLADHSIRESAAYQAMTGKGITDTIDTSALDLGYDSNFVAEYESNYIAIKTLEKLGLQASSIAYERMNKFKTIIDRHQLQGVDLELADSIVDTLLNNREMLMNYVTSLSTQFDMTAANTNASEVQENLRPVLTALQNTKQNTTLSGHLNAGGQHQANSIVLLLQARDSAARDGDNELAAAIQELIEERSTDMANSLQLIKKIKNKKDRDRAKKALETAYASNDITKPILDSWLYFKFGEGKQGGKISLDTFYKHMKKTYGEETATAAKTWIEDASKNTDNLLAYKGTGISMDVQNMSDIILKWHDLRKQFAYYEDIELPSGEVIQLPVHQQFAQYRYTHDTDGNLVTKFAQKYMHKHSANDPRAFEGIVDILDTDKIRKLSREDQEFLWKTILKGENREMYDVLENKDFDNPIFQKLMDSDGKLGDGWAALNITTAMDCLGRLEDGTCDFCDACYAYGQAAMLPEQAVKQIAKSILFANTSVEEFVDILEKQNVKILRFNQEGDFRNKTDYEKTEAIAKLAHERGLETKFYSYTKNKEVLEHIRANGTPSNYQMQDSLDESNPREHGVANYRAASWEQMLQSLKDGYRLCAGACERCEQCLRNFNKVTILRDGSDRKGLGVGVITQYLGGYHDEYSHKKHIEFFTAAQMWEEKEGKRISFDNVGKKFLEQISAGATANEVIDNYYKEQAEKALKNQKANEDAAEKLKGHQSKGSLGPDAFYYSPDSTYRRLWDATIYFKGVQNKRAVKREDFFKLISDAMGDRAAEYAEHIFDYEYADAINKNGSISVSRLHNLLASKKRGFGVNPLRDQFTLSAQDILNRGEINNNYDVATQYWQYIPGVKKTYRNIQEFLSGVIKGEIDGVDMNTPLFRIPDSRYTFNDSHLQGDDFKFRRIFADKISYDMQKEVYQKLYKRKLPQSMSGWDVLDFYQYDDGDRIGPKFLVSPRDVFELSKEYPHIANEVLKYLSPYFDPRQGQTITSQFFKDKGIYNENIIPLPAGLAFFIGKSRNTFTQYGDRPTESSIFTDAIGPVFRPTMKDALNVWNLLGPDAILSNFRYIYGDFDDNLLPSPENSLLRLMLSLTYGNLDVETDPDNLGSFLRGRGVEMIKDGSERRGATSPLDTLIHEFTHMGLNQAYRNESLDESHPMYLPDIQPSNGGYLHGYWHHLGHEFESNWVALNVFKRLGLEPFYAQKVRVKDFYAEIEKQGKTDFLQWELYDEWIDVIVENINKFTDIGRAFDIQYSPLMYDSTFGVDFVNYMWDMLEEQINTYKNAMPGTHVDVSSGMQQIANEIITKIIVLIKTGTFGIAEPMVARALRVAKADEEGRLKFENPFNERQIQLLYKLNDFFNDYEAVENFYNGGFDAMMKMIYGTLYGEGFFNKKTTVDIGEDTKSTFNAPFVMTPEIRDFINNQTSTQSSTFWSDRKKRADAFWAEQEQLEKDAFWEEQEKLEIEARAEYRRRKLKERWDEQRRPFEEENRARREAEHERDRQRREEREERRRQDEERRERNFNNKNKKNNVNIEYSYWELLRQRTSEALNFKPPGERTGYWFGGEYHEHEQTKREKQAHKWAFKGIDTAEKADMFGASILNRITDNIPSSYYRGDVFQENIYRIGRVSESIREFTSVLEGLSGVFPFLTPAIMALNTVLDAQKSITNILAASSAFLAVTREEENAATILNTLATEGNTTAKIYNAIANLKDSKTQLGQSIYGTAKKTIQTINGVVGNLGLEEVLLILGSIAAVIGVITAAVAGLKFWEQRHAESLQKAIEQRQEAATSLKASYTTYQNLHEARINETDAMKRQQIARKESIALYNLEADRIKNLNAINKETKLRGDSLWGEYGLRADFQKMGWLQALIGGFGVGAIAKYLSGDFESQYEQYEGSTGEIRRIKENALGNWMATGNQRTVSKWYDKHKMQLGQIEAFAPQLQELYDKESELIDRYGSKEEARASKEFADAVQEFANATGLNRETAEKYLDYLQTEKNVENARKVMEAEVRAITAKADAGAMKALYGDAAGMGDLSNVQDAMVYATADQIFKDAMHEMWWKQLMEWLHAIYSVLTLHWGDAVKHAKAAGAYQKGMEELTKNQKQIVKDGFDAANADERREYDDSSLLYGDTPFGAALDSMSSSDFTGKEKNMLMTHKSSKANSIFEDNIDKIDKYSLIKGRQISHSKMDILLNRFQHKVDFSSKDRVQHDILQINKGIYKNTQTIAKGYDVNQWYASGHNNGDNSLWGRTKGALLYDKGFGLPPGVDPDDPFVQQELFRRRRNTVLRGAAHGVGGSWGRIPGAKKGARSAAAIIAKILDPSNVSLIDEIIPEPVLKYGAKYGDDVIKGGKAIYSHLSGSTLGRVAKGGVEHLSGLGKTAIKGVSKVADTLGLKGAGKTAAKGAGKLAGKLGLKGAGKGLSKAILKKIPLIGPLVTAGFSIAEHNPFEKHYNEDGSEKRALQSTGEVVGEIAGSVLSLAGNLILPGAGEFLASLVLEPLGKAVGGTVGWAADELFNAGLGFLFGSNEEEKQINPNDISNSFDSNVYDAVNQSSVGAFDSFNGAPVESSPNVSVDNSKTIINIENININTEDDPDKIKTAFMNLMIELGEQVTPRTVSRTIGEPSNTSPLDNQTEETDENAGTDFHNTETNTNT